VGGVWREKFICRHGAAKLYHVWGSFDGERASSSVVYSLRPKRAIGRAVVVDDVSWAI